MNDIKTWIILILAAGTVISNYAIRGNDIKHLKEAIESMKTELLKRIERLEQRFFNKE